MTVVQRISADSKLHPHLHAVVLDGVFVAGSSDGKPVFHALPRISDVTVADLHVIRARLKGIRKRLRFVHRVCCIDCELQAGGRSGGLGGAPVAPVPSVSWASIWTDSSRT